MGQGHTKMSMQDMMEETGKRLHRAWLAENNYHGAVRSKKLGSKTLMVDPGQFARDAILPLDEALDLIHWAGEDPECGDKCGSFAKSKQFYSGSMGEVGE